MTGHLPDGAGVLAKLADHALRWFADGSYPYIVPCRGGRVAGVLLPIRPEDLGPLDEYEEARADGSGLYHRVRVRAETAAQDWREAWTYVLGRGGAEIG